MNRPERFAVIGNPIEHSLSPFIHHSFAEELGLSLIYEKIQVAEPNFEAAVLDFFHHGGKGLNITLPYKHRAFALAEVASLRCKSAKAANTLWLQDHKLHADNTDGIGLIRDLSRYLPLSACQVLLLGAGGAARGIITPLFAANIAQLTVANRGRIKAANLQSDFPQIRLQSFAQLQGQYDLIINATSASLTNQALVLPSSLIMATTWCYDLAYNMNGPTAFTNWARLHGCQAVDGLGMLVEQAAESFFIWHKVKPNTASVLAKLAKLRR